LVRGALERPAQRCDQPGVLVGDDQTHPARPRFFSPVRNARQNTSPRGGTPSPHCRPRPGPGSPGARRR
jgi:hypothetical protein